jgi:general secretion pathway protein C
MSKTVKILIYLFLVSAFVYVGVDFFYRMVRMRLFTIENRAVLSEKKGGESFLEKRGRTAFKEIIDRDIFRTLNLSNRLGDEPIEKLQPTSLEITLLGTVLGGPENSFAVIEDTRFKKQGLYKQGDEIQDAVVKRILRGKVVLRVGEKDEILTIEKKEGPEVQSKSRPVKKAKPTISTTSQPVVIPSSPKGILELMSQMQLKPHFRDGQPDGLMITSIQPNSLLGRLGLQAGDIIQEMNSQVIESQTDLMAIYKTLKNASQVYLDITRDGEPKTLNMKIR